MVAEKQVKCVVVTPEQAVLDEVADFVSVPMFDGELGILPGRSPLIGRMGCGELRIKTGATEQRFFVDGGFVQVRRDVVTLLTPRAIPVAEIDDKAAEAEFEAAKTRLATDHKHQEAALVAVERARTLVRLGKKSA